MWLIKWMIFLGCFFGLKTIHEKEKQAHVNFIVRSEIFRMRLDWPFPLPRPDDEEEMPARQQTKSVS